MDVLCQAKSGMGKTAGACPAAVCCGAAWRSPARRAGAAGLLGSELVAADAGFRARSVRAVGAAAAGARGERGGGHRALPHPRAGVSGVVPASAAASGLLCSSLALATRVARRPYRAYVRGAAQICHEFERFSVYMKVKVANFFGGLPIKQQKETLKKDCPQVIIGTPGRLKAVRGGAPARRSVVSSCPAPSALPRLPRRAVPSALSCLPRRAAGQGGRPEAGLRAALHH